MSLRAYAEINLHIVWQRTHERLERTQPLEDASENGQAQAR